MLNIICGRENLTKELYICNQIGPKPALLIVPDQYTLQAEREILHHTNKKSLANIEVLSMSRLGTRVLEKTGGSRRPLIDKQGRHMILSKLLKELDEELTLFKGQWQKPSFIEMVNNFISEMKQFGATPSRLEDILEKAEKDSFLENKLKDIQLIFEKYEMEIKDKYLDTEDYARLYANKVRNWDFIKDKEIWIYGFDYFTPNNLALISGLTEGAPSVNVILTIDKNNKHDQRDGELFSLGQRMITKLQIISESLGKEANLCTIGRECIHPKSKALSHLEEEIFALPYREFGEEAKEVTMIQAANFYAEAETAAAYTLELIREKGLKLRDIAIICNDLQTRGPIIKRVFEEYGLDLFLDEKRQIINNPLIIYIKALLDIISKGYKWEDVTRILKTGLWNFSYDHIELLENYARKYNIKGPKWRQPFTKGATEEGEETLQLVESMRNEIIGKIYAFHQDFKGGKTARERTRTLYDFMSKEQGLHHIIQGKIKLLIEKNLLEQAQELSQVWEITAKVLEELVEIVGEEKLSYQDYTQILKAGFEAVEVGVLPPALDGLLMGTMQRTRLGSCKAMVILGANEGVLPATPSDSSLLNEDEKIFLDKRQIEICKMDKLRTEEENLAIYRNLCSPENYLYISYSVSDEKGGEIIASQIFEKIQEIFPYNKVEKDITNRKDQKNLIASPKSTLRYLGYAMRESVTTGGIDPIWIGTKKWFENNQEELINIIKEGLSHSNKVEDLTQAQVEQLYIKEKDLTISPSRLEKFAKCPFQHFITYGLRPEERQDYLIQPMDMGNIYHQCLMELAKRLTQTTVPVTSPNSKWMTITEAECGEKVKDLLSDMSKTYREGMLLHGKEEEYRSKRILEICTKSAWKMVEHVKKSRIEKMLFEESFGRGKRLNPIQVNTGEGTVFIEGKIDRIDYLPHENVKIIDYKSGNVTYNLDKTKAGWALQLFIYLDAAAGKEKNPAGAFYFYLGEEITDGSKTSEANIKDFAQKEINKFFKMDGVLVNKEEVINAIDTDFLEEAKHESEIIPVYTKTNGEISSRSNGKLLEETEFDQLLWEIKEKVNSLATGIAKGEIQIEPTKIKDESACTYCQYKGICKEKL